MNIQLNNVIRDITGETGLNLAEVSDLVETRWEQPPSGFLNIGKYFDEPTTIILREEELEDIDDHGNANGSLTRLLGPYLIPDMPASALPSRVGRMKQEIITGTESLDDKLRYLLWIN